MIEIVSSQCNKQRNANGKPHEQYDGHVEGCADGLHDAVSDAKKQRQTQEPKGSSLGSEYAQKFTKDKEGFGNGLGDHSKDSFVFDLRSQNTGRNECRERYSEYVDRAHAVANHEDIVVFHGVAGNREVNDEAKKANQNNEHEDRLSDTLREGVPCDRE